MGRLAERLYRAIVLLLTLTGNTLSDEDKAELHETLTEENVTSLCDILNDCEREGIFD